MIRHLQIRNFKGWEDTGQLQLAPITLLFGGNSSGKSSLGHFLLMLQQTVQSSDRRTTLQTQVQGTPVAFGGFIDFIHRREPERDLEFSLEWQLPGALTIKNGNRKSWSTNALRLDCKIGGNPKPPHVPFVKEFAFEAVDAVPLTGNRSKQALRFGMKADGHTGYYSKIDSGFTLKQPNRGPRTIGSPDKFYRFSDEFLNAYTNADCCSDFNFELEQLLRGVSYLGPIRTYPERVYSWHGNQPESVGYDGSETISALLSSTKKKYSWRKGGWKKSLQEVIAMKLQELGLISSFSVTPLAQNAQQYKVQVCVSGGCSNVDLPDVGFGVSQVLPVLVQLYYAKPGSTIVIEQPELHLHPRAQTLLADVIIDATTNCLQDGNKRNIQVILETHSEHFLLRFQRRVAERALAPSALAAFVSTAGTEGSKLERLEIGQAGQITNWPPNFFGDQMADLMEVSKAAAMCNIEESGQ